MKKNLIIILILFFGLLSPITNNAQNKITFNVDMSSIENAKNVGIRGSLTPLTWDKTTVMKGPDKNGIYSITIDFGNAKPGTQLKYKFIYGKDKWENESIGATGNRSFILPGSDVKIAPVAFNDIMYYDTDALLENAMQDQFFMDIYDIHAANRNGNTSVDVGKNYYKFREGSYSDRFEEPQQLMFDLKVHQAKYPFGEFVIIEDKPGFVKFKFNKAWDVYMGYFGKDGIINDVTEDEISTSIKTYYAEIAKEINWSIIWEEDDKYVIMSITKN